MRRHFKILAAELIGTTVLMIGGPGSAILAGHAIGQLGIALAFGISLLAMAYAIGPISGCHINPAVTIGLWLARKVEGNKVGAYLTGQILGAALGGLIIYGIANDLPNFRASGGFAANGWGHKLAPDNAYGLGAVALVEIIFTALLVFVVLTTFSKKMAPGAGGLMVGLTLTLIHLVTIPIDNTSVNPARSFGAALFSGSNAWSQLWAFIVFPILGSAVGVLAWLAVDDARIEDTLLGSPSAMYIRDQATKDVERIADAAQKVADRVERTFDHGGEG
jgi:aquaporin Z